MTMIGLHFKDFKAMADNHRVYYYVGNDYYDFLYLVDGVIVKTTVLHDAIENMEQFFSDKLFYGAVQLTFPINNPNQDLFSRIMGLKRNLEVPFDVSNIQSAEVKNTDIQVEGSEE